MLWNGDQCDAANARYDGKDPEAVCPVSAAKELALETFIPRIAGG